MYPESFIAPMREELTRLGVRYQSTEQTIDSRF